MNCSNSMIIIRCTAKTITVPVTEQEKRPAIKEIAHVLDITGAYKFECDYAHGRPYAHGGPYEQGKG